MAHVRAFSPMYADAIMYDYSTHAHPRPFLPATVRLIRAFQKFVLYSMYTSLPPPPTKLAVLSSHRCIVLHVDNSWCDLYIPQ